MQRNILEYLENTAQKFPDKIAFANDESQWTFEELYRNSGAIGSTLAAKGYYKEAVLVYMDKSPAAIGAFFGAVMAGCFYVPLDEEMPPKRIDCIMDNTEARVMICDAQTVETAGALDFEGEILLAEELIAQEPQEELLREIRRSSVDTDPVYILYTSGSTGVPKGVLGHHRGLIDYIDQLAEVLETDENAVFGNQAPLYFDASMKEIYLTICCGCTTWLIPKQLFLFPIRLVQYLNEHRINTICWVVSALTMISAFGTFEEVLPEYLRRVTFVGEVFPVEQFNLWKRTLPQVKFTNLYGPTECTGVSCYYHAERLFEAGEAIPIGGPFPNTDVFLLREDGKLAGDEEEGELCIRGSCVTHGYYNDPKRTSEAFVQNPLNRNYPEIIYRTGDIAKRNANGELVFVSRRDHQIKHMGHRVELGEIDANVASVDGVADCCSIYAKEEGKIVLFYVGDIDKRALTKELKAFLPRYMLPNMTIQMEALLHTPTGKKDRLALEQIYHEQKRKKNQNGRD